jgi:hypothetical protein
MCFVFRPPKFYACTTHMTSCESLLAVKRATSQEESGTGQKK